MAWISYFMPRNVPRMLVRMPRSNSAGSMSARSAGMGPSVALLNAASSRPKVVSVCETRFSTDATSPTSVGTVSARPPAARIPWATASKACASRAASTTAAPACANARAVAAPMPRLAPATSATLPSNAAAIVSPCSHSWCISTEEVRMRPLVVKELHHFGCKHFHLDVVALLGQPHDLRSPDGARSSLHRSAELRRALLTAHHCGGRGYTRRYILGH